MKIKRMFWILVVGLIIILLLDDPISILFYQAPTQNELNYSDGIVSLKYGYRTGERVLLKTDRGTMVFVCRAASFGLMQKGTCPLDKQQHDEIDKKKIKVGWFVQKKWPLTSSEMQIFSIDIGAHPVLSYSKMVGFYRNLNQQLNFLVVFQYAIWITFLILMARNIF
jgi:hypothetical protein